MTPWAACFDLIETVEILMNMLVLKMKYMCVKYLTTMGVCIGYCAKGWWAVRKGLWFLNWVVGREEVWSRCMECTDEAIMDSWRWFLNYMGPTPTWPCMATFDMQPKRPSILFLIRHLLVSKIYIFFFKKNPFSNNFSKFRFSKFITIFFKKKSNFK